MPPDAAFAVEPIKDSVDVFVGWWALGGVLAAGAAYGAWEWREEVSQIIRNAVKTGRSQK